jgi:hypothetical protein
MGGEDMRFLLISVLAAMVTGCAGRSYYYENPRILPDTYEFGEVVGVSLVRPSSPYACYDLVSSDEDFRCSVRVQDAIPLRGEDGKVNLGSLFCSGRSIEEKICAGRFRSEGWRFYVTVLLDNDQEISVVESEDDGYLIGASVQVGFTHSQSGRPSDQVTLMQLSQELSSLARNEEEL